MIDNQKEVYTIVYMSKNRLGSVQKWGNSLGIRIPKQIADDMKLHDGTSVQIYKNKDTLCIQRFSEPLTLEKALSDIPDNFVPESEQYGMPIGSEIW